MYSVVTTFNEKQYKEYGQEMIRSFIYHWPNIIPLKVYFEITKTNIPISTVDNVQFLPYYTYCPEQLEFAKRNISRPKIETTFNRQAIRFSYKVFAQIHQIRTQNSKYVIWLDGDTITTKPVSFDWLKKLHTDTSYISILARPWMYTETGFILFNTEHFLNTEFINIYEKMYTEDRIFKYRAWHDCIALDETIKHFPELEIYNLSPSKKNMHPFATGILGEKMDHLKGPRKKIGFSKERVLHD